MTIDDIQVQVADWSRKNFGDQKGIHHFAPLAGVVEECGELCEAVLAGDDEQILDAVGDIGIYTLDLSGRSMLAASTFWPKEPSSGVPFSAHTLLIELGGLCHAFLKTHQGIRNYADNTFSTSQRLQRLGRFLNEVNQCFNLTRATEKTWEEIVSKRDWTQSPTGG